MTIQNKFFLLFLLVFITISKPIFAENQYSNFKIKIPIEKYKLSNGLTVILQEDHSIPMIAYHTWYKVGSKDEVAGSTGAAHMFEHMMFKGTKKYPNNEYDIILEKNGITNNAFTTTDYTGFYQLLPADKLELMMQMEVDRMVNLDLKPEVLKSEQQVVAEERRMRIDNNPQQHIHSWIMENIFSGHAYEWPVIGHMSDIQNYTIEKLKPFYEQYYVPNNAILVISGDIDLEETKKLIQKYYGNIPYKKLPSVDFKKPKEFKAKSIVKKSDIQATNLSYAFLVDKDGSIDNSALSVLCSILAGGRSSRLYKELVYENELATQVGAYVSNDLLAGYLVIVANLRPGVSVEKAKKIIEKNILKLQSQFVEMRELEKAKNTELKGFVDALTTANNRAQILAVYEILRGDYREIYADLDKMLLVKTEDVKRVASKYLDLKKALIIKQEGMK